MVDHISSNNPGQVNNQLSSDSAEDDPLSELARILNEADGDVLQSEPVVAAPQPIQTEMQTPEMQTIAEAPPMAGNGYSDNLEEELMRDLGLMDSSQSEQPADEFELPESDFEPTVEEFDLSVDSEPSLEMGDSFESMLENELAGNVGDVADVDQFNAGSAESLSSETLAPESLAEEVPTHSVAPQVEQYFAPVAAIEPEFELQAENTAGHVEPEASLNSTVESELEPDFEPDFQAEFENELDVGLSHTSQEDVVATSPLDDIPVPSTEEVSEIFNAEPAAQAGHEEADFSALELEMAEKIGGMELADNHHAGSDLQDSLAPQEPEWAVETSLEQDMPGRVIDEIKATFNEVPDAFAADEELIEGNESASDDFAHDSLELQDQDIGDLDLDDFDLEDMGIHTGVEKVADYEVSAAAEPEVPEVPEVVSNQAPEPIDPFSDLERTLGEFDGMDSPSVLNYGEEFHDASSEQEAEQVGNVAASAEAENEFAGFEFDGDMEPTAGDIDKLENEVMASMQAENVNHAAEYNRAYEVNSQQAHDDFNFDTDFGAAYEAELNARDLETGITSEVGEVDLLAELADIGEDTPSGMMADDASSQDAVSIEDEFAAAFASELDFDEGSPNSALPESLLDDADADKSGLLQSGFGAVTAAAAVTATAVTSTASKAADKITPTQSGQADEEFMKVGEHKQDKAPTFHEAPGFDDGFDFDESLTFEEELDIEKQLSAESPAMASAAPVTIPKTRKPFTIALAVLGVAMFAGVGAVAYGVFFNENPGKPPIIQADKTPVRQQPADPGGKVVANKDKVAYGGVDSSTPGAEQDELLSDAEKPIDLAKDGKSSERLEPNANESETKSLVSIAPRKVKTVTVKPDGTIIQNDPPTNSVKPADEAKPMEGAKLDDTMDTASIDGAKTTGQKAIPSPSPVDKTAAAETPKDVTFTPPKPEPKAELKPTPVKTQKIAAKPVEAAPAPAPKPAPAPVASTSGSEWAVQVSSQRSEGDAQAAYQNMKNRFGSILGNQPVEIRKAEVTGKGVYYRVRIPSSSKQAANDLCNRLKSAGGSCFITR